MTITIEESNTGAEYRAIEEGHRAWLHDGKIRVVSDTEPDVRYLVGAIGYSDGSVRFHCTAVDRKLGAPVQATHGRTGSRECGHTPCKHAALAARRLEREGLLRWDAGRWRLPEAIAALLNEQELERMPKDENGQPDPFASFPKW